MHVLNPYVGGAFGSGLRPQYQVYLATLAAKKLERSVRVVLTRQQMFTHVHRPEAIQTVSLATDTDGKLQAIVNDATSVTSRFEHYMEVICNWGLMNYACENAERRVHDRADRHLHAGRHAGPRRGHRHDAVRDRRRRDGLRRSRRPAGVPAPELLRAGRDEREAVHVEGAAPGLRRRRRAFGWSKRSAAPRSMRDGTELVGWGVATGMWDALFMKTAARARLHADGRLEVASATADIGTGSYTVMTQVASETLGLGIDRITAQLGDSELPDAPVEGGSWGAASTGAAVQLACQALAEAAPSRPRRWPRSRSATSNSAPSSCATGRMRVRGDPSRSVALDEIVRASGEAMIEAEETAKPGPLDLVSMLRKARNTHSAIFAEVKVDEELGVVRVTRIVCAVAAGRIINPKTARSQILGGVVMGIGMALHEESFVDHRSAAS